MTRFTVVACAIAIVRELPPLTQLLYFQSIVTPVRAAIQPASFAIVDALIATGAYVIGVGDPTVVENPTPRYTTRAAMLSAAFLLGCLVVATAIVGIWRLIDRGRTYPSLDEWTRVLARYVLAVRLISYGISKVIPQQFGVLRPGELIRPLGELSSFDLLWTFMAASPGYTVFAGLVELLAGLLLFWHRTMLPGALLGAAALTNVIALDMAYDVGGPLLTAFVLLVLAVIVLIPHVRPIWTFLVPSAHPHPRRLRTLATVTALLCLLGMRVQNGLEFRKALFTGRPLYGLWDVETIAAESQAGLANRVEERGVWRRTGTSGRSQANGLIVEYANGDVRHFQLDDDGPQRTWTVRQRGKDVATLRYEVEPGGAILMNGLLGSVPVKMRLRPVDPARFRLLDLR